MKTIENVNRHFSENSYNDRQGGSLRTKFPKFEEEMFEISCQFIKLRVEAELKIKEISGEKGGIAFRKTTNLACSSSHIKIR